MNNSYTINSQGIILSVGSNWDQNAIRQGATEATSENVLGRKWWEFVSGQQTRSYLTSLFFACRMDHQSLSIQCRCDSPDDRDMFRFTATPQENDTLVINCRHLKMASQPDKQDVKFISIKNFVDTKRCSICCSFLLGENWVDPFCQPDTKFFAESYGICPDCRAFAMSLVHSHADI